MEKRTETNGIFQLVVALSMKDQPITLGGATICYYRHS
jgi:hypothetical protein